MEGLKLQDEGLAMVQEAVAKHPLRALGPLLDAARWVQGVISLILQLPLVNMSSVNVPPPAPLPPTWPPLLLLLAHPLLLIHRLYPLLTLPHQVHKTFPSSQWTATRIKVNGVHKYKCSGCGVVHTTRNAVLSHIRVVHTKTELCPCPHCGVFTSTNNDSY